jgi:DNA-directed RNA polymerase
MRQTNKDKSDNRKQKQAIIPNVIHSLDASHLINLVTTANTINLTPIITIHDCFGTLPNKMGLVNNLVLKEFISLYTKGDFLQKFHKQIIKSLVDNNYEIFSITEKIPQLNNLKEGFKTRTIKYIIIDDEKLFLPNLPTIGKLDIDSIINSKYFIT